jgi:geranylgeranyl reductase family protein
MQAMTADTRHPHRPATCSVAVVGAGPAGSWVARLLARGGVQVMIFDGSHPREKPCGGGITARASALITRELGMFPVPCVEVTEATFESVAGIPGARVHRRRETIGLSTRTPDDTPALRIVNRDAFDRTLLSAACEAGATFVPERVLDVDIAAAAATVRTSRGAWTADIVIGADGANSLVRRRVAAPFTRRQLSVGAGCYVTGVSSREIAIRWVARPPGYLWSFPRHDRLAVGSCAQYTEMHSVSELKSDVSRWLRDAGILSGQATADGVALEPYSWPIPALAAADLDSSLPLGSNRWLLVGDAAGLVDPLTREGIFYALCSGALAAEAVSTGAPEAVGSRYRQAVERQILPELRRAAGLTERFFNPAFSGSFVAALARSRRIREIVNDLLSGQQSYRGLKRRLLATGRLDLALRALTGWWPEQVTSARASSTS